jgi:hypothetical protein
MSRHTRTSLTTNDAAWDLATIRRAIQILGAYRSQADDAQSTARAVRFIWDFLQRRGVNADIFQLPGLMPLLIAGNGPVLVVAHIDSPGVGEADVDPSPPEIKGDVATGPGVVRKAGVLAAAGSLLRYDGDACPITLVIEADRHQGSRSIEAWLAATHPTFVGAAIEVVDLPVPAPAIYRGAAGLLVATITMPQTFPSAADVYRSVLPDAGHQLAEMLAALKSRDAEVMLSDFYEGVDLPDQTEMDALRSVADAVGAMIDGATIADDEHLPSTHLTLGMFATPSLTVRDIHYTIPSNCGGSFAETTIELRLMPGQSIDRATSALRAFVAERSAAADVNITLERPPARGWHGAIPLTSLADTILPAAPGNTPAGILEAFGIPTLGFQTVSSAPDSIGERARLVDVLNGASVIGSIATLIAQSTLRSV